MSTIATSGCDVDRDPDAARPVARGDDVVPERLEEHDERLAVVGVVLDDEHVPPGGPSCGSRPGPRARAPPRPRSARAASGSSTTKSRRAPGPRSAPARPAVQRDEAAHEREPEPEPALAPVERRSTPA